MAEFAYNNAKNASISHTPFELNCSFHPRVSYEDDINPCFQSKTANQLTIELQNLISIYRENLGYAQKLQKRYHDKHVRPKHYTSEDKIWLNSKYIKTKQNHKLEFKFSNFFEYYTQ